MSNKYKEKIAVIIPSLNYGGAERSSLSLANQLLKKFKDIDLITLKKNTRNLNENNNLNLININKSRTLFAILHLFKVIKSNRYSTVITGISDLNLSVVIIKLFFKKK